MMNCFSGKFGNRSVFYLRAAFGVIIVHFYHNHARFEHCNDKNGANEVMGKYTCINAVLSAM